MQTQQFLQEMDMISDPRPVLAASFIGCIIPDRDKGESNRAFTRRLRLSQENLGAIDALGKLNKHFRVCIMEVCGNEKSEGIRAWMALNMFSRTTGITVEQCYFLRYQYMRVSLHNQLGVTHLIHPNLDVTMLGAEQKIVFGTKHCNMPGDLRLVTDWQEILDLLLPQP